VEVLAETTHEADVILAPLHAFHRQTDVLERKVRSCLIQYDIGRGAADAKKTGSLSSTVKGGGNG
jgi:hypothetical protein